jgi:uncharacterized membrane protein YfcA
LCYRAYVVALRSLIALAAITTRAVVASPLGFLIGLSLGAVGGGGSILAVPALVYGAGEGARVATTGSLVVVGATSLLGMIGHLRAGRVRVRAGLAFGLAGVGGSLAGSALNRMVAPHVLLLAFAALLLAAGWRMRARAAGDGIRPRRSRARADNRPGAATVLRVLTAGSIVGLLTGFFGVGGGFVIVPALVLALRYEMPVAVGTSLLVIAVNSAEALAFRLPLAGIDWTVIAPFTATALAGVIVGNLVAGRVPAARLTRWFVWLLFAVAAYTAAESLAAL